MNLYFINFKLIYKGGDFMIGFVTLNFNESKNIIRKFLTNKKSTHII